MTQNIWDWPKQVDLLTRSLKYRPNVLLVTQTSATKPLTPTGCLDSSFFYHHRTVDESGIARSTAAFWCQFWQRTNPRKRTCGNKRQRTVKREREKCSDISVQKIKLPVVSITVLWCITNYFQILLYFYFQKLFCFSFTFRFSDHFHFSFYFSFQVYYVVK